MTRTERHLLVATAVVLVAGGAAWFVIAGPEAPTTPARGGTPTAPDENAAPTPPGLIGEFGPDGTPRTDGPAPAGAGGRITPGLRPPTDGDLDDPAKVLPLLRAHLESDDPRWDSIASLVARVPGTLPIDVAQALQAALVTGNAAGALQAYAAVRDGTVVPSLLRVLDDPALDAHDKANVLEALRRIPGADAAEVVTGIEGRLTNDPAHDAVYLQAIARRGGREAARALVDAISRSTSPESLSEHTWREFAFGKDPKTAEAVALALADRSKAMGAQRALATLAGRPGAPPEVVAALAGLDAPDVHDTVRRQALVSLARTGDDEAISRLLETASRSGTDYASVAAEALVGTTSASQVSRDKILETARTTPDEHLREMLVQSLGNLGEPKAVPLLSDWLSVGGDYVRKQSAVALGRIGKHSAEAVPSLGKAFTTGDDVLRGHVAIALGSIGTPEALALLRDLSKAEMSPKVRATVANAIAHAESKP